MITEAAQAARFRSLAAESGEVTHRSLALPSGVPRCRNGLGRVGHDHFRGTDRGIGGCLVGWVVVVVLDGGGGAGNRALLHRGGLLAWLLLACCCCWCCLPAASDPLPCRAAVSCPSRRLQTLPRRHTTPALPVSNATAVALQAAHLVVFVFVVRKRLLDTPHPRQQTSART